MRAKKILILITSLLCLLLWACGSGEKENSSSNNSWFDEMKTMNNQVSNNENETNKKDNKEDEKPKGTEENTENKSEYLNVVGLYGDVAQDMLEREGFKVEVRREESNDVESGTVIRQYPSPKDNKEMSSGDTVILVVCSGKKESAKYSCDVQALDAIKTAMSVLIADRTSDYSVVDGKVNSLSVLMNSSYNNKMILNEVLSEVFDQNGYFNASSLVFEGIKTSDVKICVKRGAVSILVPVSEEYSKYFKAYTTGTYNWPDKMLVKKEGAIDLNMKVWVPQEDINSGWIEKVCEKFVTYHTEWNITFDIEGCSESDAAKNMITDPTFGADVFMFPNDQLTALVNADAIARLGGDTANYVKETNSKVMVDTVSKDGNIYGIPYTGNTWFMYYDKSVFSEEDVKSLDRMLEKGVVSFPITNSWYFASFYAAGGATFCGANGDDEMSGIQLGSNGTEVTKYIIDLVANKNFVIDESGSGIGGLKNGSVNAVFTGSWDYQNIKDILGDDMGVVSLPSININGTEGTLKSYAGSKAVGVNPNCENMEVTIEFAKYLASEEAQQWHYEMRNIVPCNTVLLEKEVFKKDDLSQAQNNTIANTSIIQPSNNTFSKYYWDSATSFAEDILDGIITKSNADEKTKQFEDDMNGR